MIDFEPKSISDLVQAVKVSLEYEFAQVNVVGEVSNLSSSAAGHFYFTLSDENASVSAALFKMDALRNPLIRRLKNGDKVILQGSISVYAKRGTFQIIGKRLLPFGKGDLKAQFELLKAKLNKEGLFDLDLKKEIPHFPKKIGVITALNGAALQDFLNVMKRRCLGFNITIIPCTAQGKDCAPSVIKAIDKAEKFNNFDTLVITRGGGSMEDLWGFNDEVLVRRVFACKIPVISAIGHQVDFTLLDFVADQRCETPSAAAEVLSQGQTNLIYRLDRLASQLKSLFADFKLETREKVDRLNPVSLLHIIKKQIHNYEKRVQRVNLGHIERLLPLNEYSVSLDNLCKAMVTSLNHEQRNCSEKLNLFGKMLQSMNPKNVLDRGYTLISDNSGKLITSHSVFDRIEPGESLFIEFSDGVSEVKK